MILELIAWVLNQFIDEDSDDVDVAFWLLAAGILSIPITLVGLPVDAELKWGDSYKRPHSIMWSFRWYYVGLLAFMLFPIILVVTGSLFITLAALGSIVGPWLLVEAGLRAFDISPQLSNDQLGRWLPESLRKNLGIPKENEWEILTEAKPKKKKSDAPNRPLLSMEQSILIIGPTRMGKTYALMMLAAQLDYSDNAVIAHGSVADFTEFFASDLGLDVIVLGKEGSTHQWNIFKEAQDEEELREIAKSLFRNPQTGSTGDDYFDTAAPQVFAAILTAIHREVPDPSHEEIRRAVSIHDATEMYEKLSEHSDLATAATQIDPVSERQQQGVWGQLTAVVEDIFIGDFQRAGDFTFREYLDNPRGRAVVFETPEVKSAVDPMYRVLADQAIKYSMEHERECFMFLDEIDNIPKLDNLGGLVARGLAQDVRPLIGIQTKGQLEAVYEKDTDGILGNCKQIIGFGGANDNGKTARFYQNILGKRREDVTSVSTSKNIDSHSSNTRKQLSTKEEDRYPITTYEINHWEKGKCLISTEDHWWVGKLAKYPNIKHRYLDRDGKERT